MHRSTNWRTVIGVFGLALVLMASSAVAASAKLEVTKTNAAAGESAVEWGPPIGWSAAHGEICGDANDEDPGFACLHDGVPAGTKKITLSGSVDTSKLDPSLEMLALLITIDSGLSAPIMAQPKQIPSGQAGYQKFELSGDVTTETDSTLIGIVFKIVKKGSPQNSLAKNTDTTSQVFIDDLSLKFDDGENLLKNGSFEDGTIKEPFADFMGLNTWIAPKCASDAPADAPAEGDTAAASE